MEIKKEIKQADFDDKIDIMPVADPNIFSQTQRIATAQTELQLAQSNPQMHNLYEAYRDMYTAIGVKNIDQIFTPTSSAGSEKSGHRTYRCNWWKTFSSV